MNASQILNHMDCLTEVLEAACSYHDHVRGLDVRQRFFIFPDDTIVALNAVDGSYETLVLQEDDIECLRARHPVYFH